jgi:hypothetical protein
MLWTVAGFFPCIDSYRRSQTAATGLALSSGGALSAMWPTRASAPETLIRTADT